MTYVHVLYCVLFYWSLLCTSKANFHAVHHTDPVFCILQLEAVSRGTSHVRAVITPLRWIVFLCFLFLFCVTSVACRPITSLLSSSFFLLSFSLWFIGLLHRFFLSVCVYFWSNSNKAQFHTNVYNYVKYTAQRCCESVMAFFFFF